MLHVRLVDLSIGIEEYNRRLLEILWHTIILSYITRLLHLLLCQYFVFIEREEHAVKLGSVAGLDRESPTIIAILEQFFQLAIRMKQILIKCSKAAKSAAEAVEGMVCPIYDVAEFDGLLFKIFKQRQILWSCCYAHCIITEIDVGA